MNITLGFMNYNSFSYIERQLANDYFTLSNGIINEIVIQDDCSVDDFEKLKKLQTSNVKVFQNEKRLKPLLGRINLVNNCSNDWVIIMDSDNFLDRKSFEVLTPYLNSLRENIIYCADYARPEFSYKYISNALLDFKTVRQHIARLSCFLNTGNYLVNKKRYLEIANQIDPSYAEYTLEVMYYAYLWLKNGNYLKCVENFEYDHTMRDDCFSLTNDRSHNEIFQRLCNLFQT